MRHNTHKWHHRNYTYSKGAKEETVNGENIKRFYIKRTRNVGYSLPPERLTASLSAGVVAAKRSSETNTNKQRATYRRCMNRCVTIGSKVEQWRVRDSGLPTWSEEDVIGKSLDLDACKDTQLYAVD